MKKALTLFIMSLPLICFATWHVGVVDTPSQKTIHNAPDHYQTNPVLTMTAKKGKTLHHTLKHYLKQQGWYLGYDVWHDPVMNMSAQFAGNSVPAVVHSLVKEYPTLSMRYNHDNKAIFITDHH